jgi:hypothetical protein
MNKIQTKTVGRFTAAVAISMGLAASAVSIASASTNGSHHSDHDGFAGQTHWDNGLGGLVTAVTLTSGTLTSVTVTAHDGTPSTFSITGTTTFSEGGATVPATDLVVGSHVDIQVTSALPTTAVAINIKVKHARPIKLGGLVTAVTLTSGTLTSVTVTAHDGTPSTFSITGTTTFSEGGATVPATDLVAGDFADIEVLSSAMTTATSINIELARFGGVVTLVSGDTITITGHKGVTQTIVVGTTTYTKDGAPAVSTDVMAGDLINAQGTIGATATTLNATSVMIETLHGSIDGGHVGHGHRHFDGRGFGHHQGSQNQGSQNQGFGERGSSDHGNIRR